MADLADVPLPQGVQALHEAVLLGRALLNFFPEALERTVLADQAWSDSAVPRERASVHVRYVRSGQTVDESYVHLDAYGGGKHDRQHDLSVGPAYELVVDLGRHPARDRFLRLHADLRSQLGEARSSGRELDPQSLQWWEFVDAAAESVATEARPDQQHEALAELPLPRPDVLEAVAHGMEGLTDELRRQGLLTIWPATALLVAAYVPLRVAAGDPEQLARHLTYALLEARVSPWQAIYGVVQKGVREGLSTEVGQAADALLADAERHRDLALDGTLDRDVFSRTLFLGAPRAWAAMQLYRLLRDASPDPEPIPRQKRRVVAEELAVRMQDGVVHQWLDVGNARTAGERRKVQETLARGDEPAVRDLLLQGERRLLRPRAARDLLLDPS